MLENDITDVLELTFAEETGEGRQAACRAWLCVAGSEYEQVYHSCC